MQSDAVSELFDGQSPSPGERRLGLRVAAHLPVELFVAGQDRPLLARSRDIGTGGVCVETDASFCLSDLEKLSLGLPSGSLTLAATGRWQYASGPERALFSGIRFDDPDAAAQRELWDYAHRRVIEVARCLHDCVDLGAIQMGEALALAQMTRLRQIPAGRWIFHQGQCTPEANGIFIVYRGSVMLCARADAEHEVGIERVEEGRLFGGISMLAKLPPAVTATAGSELTLLEIDQYAFRYLEKTRPALASLIAAAISRRQMAQLDDLVQRLAALSPEGVGASSPAPR